MSNDEIIFPDSDRFSSPRAPEVTEMTTSVSDHPEPESDEALIGVIVTLVIVIVGFIVLVFVRKYRRDSAAAKAKLMEEGHPQISLPTLGTQYELNSLLSLNTIGRKDSRQSEFSVTSGVATDKPDVLDIRVSKYIDGPGEDTVDDINDTLETILNNTSDTLNQSTVEQKNLVTLDTESKRAPELQVLPPSPSPSIDKQRPKSDFFVLEIPPVLPIKKSLKHAASEMSLLQPSEQMSKHVGKSDSNISSKAAGPSLPPKLTPLLPPKQMINKSREDFNKINKDIMRKSTQQTAIKGLKSNPMMKSLDITDIDYDFPAPSNDHEYDEYDEPQPVINEEQNVDEHDMDYDNPVTRYK